MFTIGQTVVTIRRLKVIDEARNAELFRLLLTTLEDAVWEQVNADYEASLQPSKIVWRVEHHRRGLSFFRPVLRELCFWDDFDSPDAALAEFDSCSEALTDPGLVGGLAGWAREIGASFQDCWRWVFFRCRRPDSVSATAVEEAVNDRYLERHAAEQRELLAAERALQVGAANDAIMLAADPSQPEFWTRLRPEEADAVMGCPD